MNSDFNELNFIWRIGNLLTSKMTPSEVLSVLTNAFSYHFDIKSLNIIEYNPDSRRILSFFGKNDTIDEISSKKYLNIISKFSKSVSFMLNKKLFEFDENFNLIDTPFLIAIENILYIPISKDKKQAGIIEIIFNPLQDKILDINIIKSLFIVSLQIYDLIMNENLNKKISKSADFYKAQKNIAKILETQYDYSFLIPLIGEILDNFAKDYFFYIFMKNDDEKFTLSWPLRYDKKRIDKVLKTIDMKRQIINEYQGTLVVFPVFFENALKGAIVIDGKNTKITDEDIDYLSRLSVQTATTLDKAGVYAEIEKYAKT